LEKPRLTIPVLVLMLKILLHDDEQAVRIEFTPGTVLFMEGRMRDRFGRKPSS
jgi:hypothetical protein